MSEKVRCLIIGSGPAGCTAAIYTARANLFPVLYQGLEPGGQLTLTNEIENFPGFPEGISGAELMDKMQKQAEKFGAAVRFGLVTAVDFSSRPYQVIVDNEKTIEAETIIIATGAKAKYLDLPDEQKFAGAGVSACATCDGFFYRNKKVAVVGGGDSACEEALYLANIATKVYMIVRKPYLRASKILQERVKNHPKIEILFEHETVGLTGEKVVQGANLVKRRGQHDEEQVHIEIDGFFLAIGHQPNSKIFKPWLETDETGYLKTIAGTPCTKLPGIFAAGDVADPHYRQAVTAAGSGCQAAIEAERFLSNQV